MTLVMWIIGLSLVVSGLIIAISARAAQLERQARRAVPPAGLHNRLKHPSAESGRVGGGDGCIVDPAIAAMAESGVRIDLDPQFRGLIVVCDARTSVCGLVSRMGDIKPEQIGRVSGVAKASIALQVKALADRRFRDGEGQAANAILKGDRDGVIDVLSGKTDSRSICYRTPNDEGGCE